MTVTTSSVFVTASNNPYTLSSGNEISVTSWNDNNHAGEAIYTSFSQTNATTVGGPTIVIDGTVIDNSWSFNADQYGIQSTSPAAATLDNFGTISAPNMFAVGINNGLIINELKSTITGRGGIRIGTGSLASTIINDGMILGSGQQGIDVLIPGAASFISNASSGFIRGGTSGGSIFETGVYVITGTVINAGTIGEGGTAGFSVDFFGTTGGNELILDPGQALTGVAAASGSANFIVLGGTAAGTLANPSNYHGFTLLSVAAGADWQIGAIASAVSLTGVASIEVAGTLDLLGSITGTTINMDGNGADSAVDFTGTNTGNSITNFGASDSILVTGFSLRAGQEIVYDYDNGKLAVSAFNPNISMSTDTKFFNVSGDLVTQSGAATSGVPTGEFTFTTLANGELVIADAACFASGTRILTPDGGIAVEQIKAGDEVLTIRAGTEGIAAVIWTGSRTIDLTRHAMPEKVRPIRILAGGFGDGLPERDLLLSPDHALYIDGYLIEAKTLVNGVTVIVEANTRFVTYYHIELAAHGVVLAEGVPAETYLESGNRMNFESDAAPMGLHPDFVTACRDGACAPLLTEGVIVTAARRRLLDRAIALGFSATSDLDLTVEAGGAKLWPEPDMDGELLFVLPAAIKTVSLLSATGVPAELSADPSDRRTLGVDVASITLIANGKRTEIALDDPAHEGFHPIEDGHRWTNGAAKIALPAHSGRAVLEVTITGQAARWRAAPAA